ncbi:BTAD domain-containing putative transcriptional regulator [Streptomyces sp. NPDC058486]|uniref:BTAD domain-containing putative transcriptional regulator n=1 Tax=unclassified Streptomyces TaxID=2593676 RepID=UPI003664F47A
MTVHHHFSVLGPLRVHGTNGPVRLGGNRQRILLTMLLLEANRVVGAERLIEAIWSDSPPATVRGQLRICISGLRRILSAAHVGVSIETHPSGYLIRMPRTALDLASFEDFLGEARAEERAGEPERAVARLEEALDLWHGQMGAGLGSELLDTATLKIHEDRLAAIEDRFRLELALGRHRQVVGELTLHVRENPYQERLCAQLMVALHRSGRSAEALALYQETRRRLSRELGLEPGLEVRRTERMILNAGRSGPYSGLPAPASAPEAFPGAMVTTPSAQDRIALLERELAELRRERAGAGSDLRHP